MLDIKFSNDGFEHSRDTGMLIGVENILRSEMSAWWKTRRWWVNILIWSTLVNVMLLLLLSTLPKELTTIDTALQMYTLFIWMGSSVGVIILMQDSVVGEKLSGTAEWLLSKPVSRSSMIAGKIVSNLLSAFVTMLVVPSGISYVILITWGFEINIVRFLGGIMLLLLNLAFFLTFAVMMGTLSSSRSVVLGLPLGFLFGQQFLTSISVEIYRYLPYSIANQTMGLPLVPSVIMGTELWSVLPIYSAMIAIFIFVVVSIKRFELEEF